MERLPAYVEDQVPQNAFDALLTRIISSPLILRLPDARIILETYVEGQRAPPYHLYDAANFPSPRPIEEYPADPDLSMLVPDPTLICIKQRIVEELFRAIWREDDESVALLIQNNLVTANTTYKGGLTPLLAAILANVMPIVKQLLVLGADPNKFGVMINKSRRTPLMLAASRGSLPIVKLLFEDPYCANDALVAPDGQIALRLAAAGGHTAVVAYLPTRRAGGFLRFRAANAANVARIKKTARSIRSFVRYTLWDLPKLFLWTLPKHLVVFPAIKRCKWCWENRRSFAQWCKYQVAEVPKRLERAGKAVARGLKKIPDYVAKIGMGIRRSAIWIWKLSTVRIPRATVIALKWIWSGLHTLGITAWSIITRVASFIHTVLLGIFTFFRGLTLRDIWNALYDVLHTVFFTLPATLSFWFKNLGRVSYQIMDSLFGWFGKDLWWGVVLLGELVMYVPMKMWFIIQNIGNSLAKASHEVLVWVDPKV